MLGVVHASRVLASASSRSRTFLWFLIFTTSQTSMKDCFGETTKPARETRALPKNSARIISSIYPMARLHEYQGKAILAANGFKIPRGRAAATADEAVAAAKEL